MSKIRSVTIVGVGLIGGSVGLALRGRNSVAKVVGFGSRPATLQAAQELRRNHGDCSRRTAGRGE